MNPIHFYRNSHPEVFCKKCVLRNFAKFTGVFLRILRNFSGHLFYRTPPVAASVSRNYLFHFLMKKETALLIFKKNVLRSWACFWSNNLLHSLHPCDKTENFVCQILMLELRKLSLKNTWSCVYCNPKTKTLEFDKYYVVIFKTSTA